MAVCRAYAVASYTVDLKNGDFSICSTTGVAVCRAYAIRPLHGRPEKWRFFYLFDHCRGRLWGVFNTPLPCRTKIYRGFGSFLFGESKIESELDSFDHLHGRLWGVFNTPLHGQTKTGLVFSSFLSDESKIESELDSFDHLYGRL